MHKSYFLALSVGLFIFISSCHRPAASDQGTVTLKINPTFGSTMVLNRTYTAPDGKTFNFAQFKMYLSHIKLIYGNGNTIEVKPIAYFSLDDSTTFSLSLTAPAGSYKGIQFYIGLDSAQDATPVNILDSTNPFYVNNSMIWTAALQYTFVKLDIYATPTNLVYHVGTSPYYTAVPLVSKSFAVAGGAKTPLVLNADIQQVFYGGTNPINTATGTYTETEGNNDTLAHQFITDLSQVFSLQ